MLPAGGRPVIAHTLEWLGRYGVTDTYMNAYHRADVLMRYCRDGSQWGLNITYAVESELLGTAGAVRNFAKYLGHEPFFVVYGDNYFFECDPRALFREHVARGALATIALFEKADVAASGVVEIDANGRVVRFVEKPKPGATSSQLVNGGLYVLSADVLPLIPSKTPCDFGYDVFPALVASERAVYGHRMEGEVWAMDTPALYRVLSKRVRS